MRLAFWKRTVEQTARELRDLWLQWLELSGYSAQTIDGYRRQTNQLLKRFPELAMSEFDDEHLQGIIEEASLASRQRARAPYANWFGWAYRTKRIPADPMRHVPTYKVPAREPIDTFTEAECVLLCGLPEPDGTLMALLLGTGLRKNEARNLTVKRLDVENAELNIIEGAKGGSAGVVPVSHSLMRRLERYIETEGLGPDDFFWYCHPGGTPTRRHDRAIAPGAFHSWWVRSVEAAGVRYRNLHTTRHTHATTWRRRGLPLDDVSDLLRHADPRTTRRVYVHLKAVDIRKRMEAIASDW